MSGKELTPKSFREIAKDSGGVLVLYLKTPLLRKALLNDINEQIGPMVSTAKEIDFILGLTGKKPVVGPVASKVQGFVEKAEEVSNAVAIFQSSPTIVQLKDVSTVLRGVGAGLSVGKEFFGGSKKEEIV